MDTYILATLNLVGTKTLHFAPIVKMVNLRSMLSDRILPQIMDTYIGKKALNFLPE